MLASSSLACVSPVKLVSTRLPRVHHTRYTKYTALRVCIEPRIFSGADDDSEVQTTLRTFQVKNIPQDPFSQIAKPTPTSTAVIIRAGYSGASCTGSNDLLAVLILVVLYCLTRPVFAFSF